MNQYDARPTVKYLRMPLPAWLLPILLVACQTGETPEAELWLAQHPDSEWAWSQAAASRLNRQDYRGAAEAFEKLLQYNGDDAFNYAYLAVARAHLGDRQGAREMMNEALAVATAMGDANLPELVAWHKQWSAANYAPDRAFPAPQPLPPEQ